MGIPKAIFKKNVEEIFTKKFWRDVTCELVATFCLVTIQSALALSWPTSETNAGTIQYALGLGLVVIILMETFAPMGGAHMNPAVSIGFALAGQMTFCRG